MTRFIHRYARFSGGFLVVVCVVLCAGLAARAANHVIEGTYLGESAGSQLPPMARASKGKIARPERSKSGAQMAERNIFCADCSIAIESPVAVAAGDGIPMTSLPIELLATSLSSFHAASFATLRNSASSRQGSFQVGQAAPGAGAIERIGATYVVFHNPAADRLEKVSLLAKARPGVRTAANGPQKPVATSAGSYAESVLKTGENSYAVERELVDKLIANPTKLGARAVPARKNGQNIGVRLYAIRKNSPLAAIDIRNGDTIQSINGFEIDPGQPDKMLAAYDKLKDAENLKVSIVRRGKPIEMSYQVR